MNSEKKPRGRPIKYILLKRRGKTLFIRQSKTRYMLNKEWICIVCDNHNYTLSGKCKHLHTKKHNDAVIRIIMNKIIDITHKK